MKIRIVAATTFLALSVFVSACDSSPTATPGAANPQGNTNNTNTNPQPANNNPPAGSGSGARAVVIGSKDFTEEVILGEIYAISLEVAGIPVQRKPNLGGTTVAQEALIKGGAQGGIDLYPEYTGTGLLTVLKAAPIQDPNAAYDAVKKGYEDQFKLTWLDKTPANDTQAFVTTITNSQKLGLKTIQDLCDKAGQITLAARAEFKDRPDALPAVQKLYGGCQFKEFKAVTAANLLYQALIKGDVDAAQADGTAGEISGYKLVLLDDPKHYGPPDNIAPVVRDDVLKSYPKIADALNKASAKITNEEIQKMNWDVAGKGMEPHDVAKKWLYDQKLLPK